MLVVRLLRKVFSDGGGATSIEYGLIVSLIVIAIVGAMNSLASSTIEMWEYISTTVQSNL